MYNNQKRNSINIKLKNIYYLFTFKFIIKIISNKKKIYFNHYKKI